MNYIHAHATARVKLMVCCCLALVMAAAPLCYVAPPELQPTEQGMAPAPSPVVTDLDLANDDLIARMLTPRAQIRLGPGLANTEALMRRASNQSLSYTVRSVWSGIVEYLFPPHGVFRRGDLLVRVYDPALLSELERARRQMDSENVHPLTIATMRARQAESEAVDPQAARPHAAAPTPAATAAVSSRAAAAAPATAPVATRPAAAVRLVQVPQFDFEANSSEQDQLREQARLAGTAVPAAIDECRAALKELNAAQDKLAQRHRLLEQGALAKQALLPSEERMSAARAAYSEAEAQLAEAQEGYDRIAERIHALEAEAEKAHAEVQAAREENARRAEAAAKRSVPAPARQITPPAPRTPIALETRGTRSAEAPADTPERTASDPAATGERDPGVRVYRITEEMRDLTAPRWEELPADAAGVISEVLAPEGSTVKQGDELLRVANLQIARLTTCVPAQNLAEFRIGRSVTVEFEEYPDAIFGGWISDISLDAGTDQAEIGLMVVCRTGRFADDPYLALRWMTLESGIGQDKGETASLEPVLRAPHSATADSRLAQIFPTIGPGDAFVKRATEATLPLDDHFTGRLELQPMECLPDAGQEPAEGARRLAALSEWRRTYVDGMTTAVLDGGTCISYPAEGEVSDAIRLMLEARVHHRPNLCAATMREALGWGLGDAHQWATRLPKVGYVARKDGLPRPGDILVWPFTYGSGRSQHIGFAVRQGRKLMLLSNLTGTLGTTEVLDGYIAFYRPDDQPAAEAELADAAVPASVAETRR